MKGIHRKLRKGFYPTPQRMTKDGLVKENRKARRSTESKDRPGKLFVVGKTKYRTRLQIIEGKKIIHYDY